MITFFSLSLSVCLSCSHILLSVLSLLPSHSLALFLPSSPLSPFFSFSSFFCSLLVCLLQSSLRALPYQTPVRPFSRPRLADREQREADRPARRKNPVTSWPSILGCEGSIREYLRSFSIIRARRPRGHHAHARRTMPALVVTYYLGTRAGEVDGTLWRHT